jgi:hypothetical protein
VTADTLVCDDHGVRTPTFVCIHLFTAMKAGTLDEQRWVAEEPVPDDPEPAAWCLECDRVLDGEDGEWTDRFSDFAAFKLLCDRCFEPIARGALPVL